MKKAVITISQEVNSDEVEVSVKTWSEDNEIMIACESHVLALIILDHIREGTFNNELALQMKGFNHLDDED